MITEIPWAMRETLIEGKGNFGALFQGGPCFSTKLAPFVFEPVLIRLKAPITQTAPVAASRLTAAIATTVLTGWILQIDPLKNFAPGMIAMNPITAGGLIAASVALFLRQAPEASKKDTILGQALAAGVIVMGDVFFCSPATNHSLPNG